MIKQNYTDLIFALLLFLVLASLETSNVNFWATKTSVLVIICLVYLGYKFAGNIAKPLSIPFAYMMLLPAYRVFKLKTWTTGMLFPLFTVTRATLISFAVVAFIGSIKIRNWKYIDNTLRLFVIAHSVVGLIQYAVGGTGNGLLGERTMAACFCATFIPLFFELRGFRKAICILPIASILLSNSTIASGLLCIATMCYFGLRGVAAILPIIAAGAYLFQGHSFLMPGDRFRMQMQAVEWFINAPLFAQITGFGPGSFMVMSASVLKGNPTWWPTLHSDVLQFVFQFGIIGSLLMLPFCFSVVRKTFLSNKTIRAIAVCMIVMCCVEYPFFRAEWIVVIMLFVKRIFQMGNEQEHDAMYIDDSSGTIRIVR